MMDCPRCHKPMGTLSAHPKGDQEPFDLALCETCGGLWLQREAIPSVCPTVSGLDKRELEIACYGRPGTGISRCPACFSTPYEFAVTDLLIDYCFRCGGIWLDGPEHVGITRGIAPGDRAKLTRSGSPYRSVEHVSSLDRTRCAICAGSCWTKDTMVSSRGLICLSCYRSDPDSFVCRDKSEDGELEPVTGSALLALLREALSRIHAKLHMVD